MTKFELSDESLLIKETISKYCDKEIRPIAASLDQASVFQESEFLRIFNGLGKLGILGLLIPEEYGGTGGDLLSVAIVIEELSKVSPGIAFSYLAHTPVMAYANIYRNGTDEQRNTYLRSMCNGSMIGANAVTEPDAGSDLFNIRTTAEEESNCFKISGSKVFITNARIADVIFVLAKDKANNGMSCFLVEKNTEGFCLGKDLDKCGYRSSPTSEIFFQDCRIPKKNLLGERGKGLKATLSEIELQRILLAHVATGLAEAAMEEAVRYAKERVQFGRPIADYQMIKSMIADMATHIEVGKSMNLRVVYEYQESRRLGKKESSLLALMAKRYASTMCLNVVLDAVQIHGSNGLMKEYPVERYFRDSKMLDIAGGTNEMLKLSISRIILK